MVQAFFLQIERIFLWSRVITIQWSLFLVRTVAPRGQIAQDPLPIYIYNESIHNIC
jgi:hypothetical protein